MIAYEATPGGYSGCTLSLPQPDPEVLRRAQKGDEQAFTLIVRAYETPVHNYILRLTGDRTLAEDLTQEVFVRVFHGLPRFSLRCKFTTWLFQVTKNRVLDELRARERRPQRASSASTTCRRSSRSTSRSSGWRRSTRSGARSRS